MIMKLIRFGEYRKEKPGVELSDGIRADVSEFFSDYNREFFLNDGLRKLKDVIDLRGAKLPAIPKAARIGSPVARPGKVLCIGWNYRDHAAESGAKVPDEPVLFMKAPNAVCGPYDNIIIPRKSDQTDYEVEFGVIIGRDARYLASKDDSFGYIAGYAIANDVSERHFQKERGGQWTKGKSSDNFCPLGPWLVTKDEISDPQAVRLTSSVNGQIRQNASSVDQAFGVAFLVHYLSQFMTLEAGDLLCTGTPPGVAMGMKPPQYLKAGDVVEMSVEGLGRQRCTCVNA
jgi:2,4-didehydro-3-deoxy-L-rhamnonate hydrolase